MNLEQKITLHKKLSFAFNEEMLNRKLHFLQSVPVSPDLL